MRSAKQAAAILAAGFIGIGALGVATSQGAHSVSSASEGGVFSHEVIQTARVHDAARYAWMGCVVLNLTSEGRGSDADMIGCDNQYTETTGERPTFALTCAGEPSMEHGKCWTREDPGPRPSDA